MSISDRSADLCPHHDTRANRACERCRSAFCDACLVRLRNQWLCAGCKHAILSKSFATIGVAAAPTAGTAAPLGSPCSTHPEEAALAICERCGDFMCTLCTTPFEGRYYCLSCFELQWGRGSLMGAPSVSYGWGLAGLILGGCSILCAWNTTFAALLATAGVAAGTIGLSVKGQDRGPSIAALVVSVLGAAVIMVLLTMPEP